METNEELLYLLGLSRIEGVGPVLARQLIAWGGGAKRVFSLGRAQLRQTPGIGEKLADAILAAEPLNEAEKTLRQCEKLGISLVPYYHGAYPTELKNIHGAPLVLYYKGNWAGLLEQPKIAIVGTRKASDYGRQQAVRFARTLAEAGVYIISGLAFGIDAEAHRACLDAGANTAAILGHGLHTVYPGAHHQLADKIADKGVLASEYPPGVGPDAMHFPARNRIIAGLCTATLVIEAAEKGGALITARIAFDENRAVFALPGNVTQKTSAGCHKLIQENVAQLLSDPEQVLKELFGERQTQAAASAAKPGLEGPAARLFDLISAGQGRLQELQQKANLSNSELLSLLLELEFMGHIRQLPGPRYVPVS